MNINFSQCNTALSQIGKITLKNVSGADKNICDFLRENSPKRLKELAKMNCYAADKIKKELDQKYGANNYVLVAIGRSLSSVAELMGHMGVDTKIIPLSGLRRSSVDNISPENLHAYKSFLVQIGLSKTDLKNNKDKTYILMDYTHYGNSLEQAEKLLKRKELLGDTQNLISMPVSKILGDDYEKMGYKILFECNRFKNFSYVGKLHISELFKVFERCSPDRIKEFVGNITQVLRNLFWFNVFDSLKENSYKNIIPNKELRALQEHYFSQQAIRNYIVREQQKVQTI